jgi:hypothetical protein
MSGKDSEGFSSASSGNSEVDFPSNRFLLALLQMGMRLFGMPTISLHVTALLKKQNESDSEMIHRLDIWSRTIAPEIIEGTVPGTDPDPNPDPEPEPDPDPIPPSVPFPSPDPGFPIDPFPRPVPVHVTTIFPYFPRRFD